MKISHYFSDLRAIYVAEIEDLTTDSGGGDVLKARLREKRAQISDLLPMMETNPEMLAVAFHKSVIVKSPRIVIRLLACEPEEFPAWEAVSECVLFEPWATSMVETMLDEAGGEQFLLTTVALEYLYSLGDSSAHASDDEDEDEDHIEGDSDDLAEAGDQWLSDQGFDSQK